MANQDRIYIRVPIELKQNFLKWCDVHKIKPSEFFRRKIDEVLAADDKAKIIELENEIRILKEEIRRAKKS